MPRPSNQDAEGVTWQDVSIPLGPAGLDLRIPLDITTLSELLNARFPDERTLSQRRGHRAVHIYDGSDAAPLGPGAFTFGVWLFGHGTQVIQ